MENLNKLNYSQYKVNDKLLHIPMEDIKQEYDDKKFAKKPYLFKILYIGKYSSKTNEFIVYLGPPLKSKLPIIKATMPLEILRLSKLIPSYDYNTETEWIKSTPKLSTYERNTSSKVCFPLNLS